MEAHCMEEEAEVPGHHLGDAETQYGETLTSPVEVCTVSLVVPNEASFSNWVQVKLHNKCASIPQPSSHKLLNLKQGTTRAGCESTITLKAAVCSLVEVQSLTHFTAIVKV